MNYLVEVSPEAKRQVADISAYIAHRSSQPEAYEKWLGVFENAMSSLDQLPCRFPILETEPWRSKGLRKMPIKSYIAYYSVDEQSKIVSIYALVYGRRDQEKALKRSLEK